MVYGAGTFWRYRQIYTIGSLGYFYLFLGICCTFFLGLLEDALFLEIAGPTKSFGGTKYVRGSARYKLEALTIGAVLGLTFLQRPRNARKSMPQQPRRYAQLPRREPAPRDMSGSLGGILPLPAHYSKYLDAGHEVMGHDAAGSSILLARYQLPGSSSPTEVPPWPIEIEQFHRVSHPVTLGLAVVRVPTWHR